MLALAQVQPISENINKLKETLNEMPENMRLFSSSLRVLFSKETDVSGDSDSAKKFRELRDATKEDAMVYLRTNLSMTTYFVRSIEKYFDKYEFLSFEEWGETLPEILEETRVHKKLAHEMLEKYEKLMVPLKKREDEARVIMKEFKDLQRDYICQKQELEAKAQKKRRWAYGLAFIPGVNLIASPWLGLSSKGDKSKANSKMVLSKASGASALTVAETLLPALTSFVEDLRNAAKFFSTIEQELQSFEGRAKKSETFRKRLHYKAMCNAAKTMKFNCRSFYNVLPSVLNDFSEIPFVGNDNNCLERWLEENLEEIALTLDANEDDFEAIALPKN
ncbi:uncharacterized protein LOC114523011 [Dendronephthya gigantea]|uniref:uncharacterized protein LOC114523011 n=1 Tax=Dendronephthya gigantea TaxID=151771 RepID=UPI00106CC03E|nr:uncharacterized protein LOC114523011 [Dendronephthya gigantea]